MTSPAQTPLGEDPVLCDRCTKLGLSRGDFEAPPFIPEGKYHSIALRGTIGELRARESHCALCRLILYSLSQELAAQPEVLSDWDRKWEAEWLQNTFEYDPASDEAQELYGSGLYPRLEGTTTSSNYGVQLVDDAGTTKPLRARLIAETVDFRWVQSWIHKCRDDHGPYCVDAYLTAAAHPIDVTGFMVIDIERKCLSRLPEEADYLALSYVWGKTNFPVTSKANVELFKVDGAFRRVKLARTIRDAMEVTAGLGHRFLWVDSICIVQDDANTKKTLIENMDAVYSNAVLTIVAATASHAGAGFLSRRDVDASETRRGQAVATVSPGFTLGVIPFFDREIMDSVHTGRGWTYQEGCLSARCLVFLRGLVFFVCRASVWREDLMAESDEILPFEGANTLGRTVSEWPLRRLADHVQAYSSRQLTYANDILNAFTGVQKALTRSCRHSQMLWGLPAAAFDWAILWQQPPGQLLRRRPGFPSWSWMGWAGTVNMATDTWSEFDQRWLCQRTWIDWHIVDEQGTEVPLWTLLENEGRGEGGPRSDDNHHHNSSEEDYDENFMPRYGVPTQYDNFGRSSTHLASLGLPLPDKTTPSDSDGTATRHLSPASLSFSTFTASLCLDFFIEQVRNEMFAIRVISASLQTYGFLQLPGPGSAKRVVHSDSLIVLSYAPPGVVQLFEAEESWTELGERLPSGAQGGRDGEDGEDVLGTWHAWNWLNVMLIDDIAAGCGRQGLGILHRDALQSPYFDFKWSHVVLS